MKINATTKIATLLKHGPRALEAIVRISPKFIKLRNPLLRRLLARRTTIAMASKISGCEVTDFFEQLKPLGFEVEETVQEDSIQCKAPPPWLLSVTQKDIEELDVRPLLDAGKDPIEQILEALRTLPRGHVLKI